MTRHLLAEALGTLLLVCTVVGSGIMAAALAGGNDAIALLGNTIATGAILYVLITILGPVSGAHFNPAVSLVFFARGELTAGLLVLYVLVQCMGGIAGTVLAHAMFDMELLVLGTKARTGAGQWLAEGVATFGLIDNHFGRLAPSARSGAHAGRALHNGRLLVYRVNEFCQSRRNAGAQLYRQFFRHSARRHARICAGPDFWRAGGGGTGGLAFSARLADGQQLTRD